MTRYRTKHDPWIENIIINHDTEKEMSSCNLKARVVGVGKMSHSQTESVQCPPDLLFLSDGVVQIPAILTDIAWEHLQEQEDRECISSLVNTTVCLQTYSLQFQMASEERKCRFFLLIGKLGAVAAGPMKECKPCCTTLPSVRLKICETWKALQDQNSDQSESSGVNLTELLDVWKYDCLMDLAEDVRKRLTTARSTVSPQPSTSCNPPIPPLEPYTRTKWDADRSRYKRTDPFTIPAACLLIPDKLALGSQTEPVEGSETPSGLVPSSSDKPINSPPASQPNVIAVQSVESDHMAGVSAVETTPRRDIFLKECEKNAIADESGDDVSNPWNIFPPPSEVFSTSSSSEASQTSRGVPSQDVLGLRRECKERAATSTQVPPRSQGHSPTLLQSKGDQSFLPAYQIPQPTLGLTPISKSSDSTTPQESGSNIAASSGSPCFPEGNICVEDPDVLKEVIQTKPSRVKRKRSEHVCASVQEETQVHPSPPSWLFESQAGSRPDAGCSSKQDRVAGPALNPPVVHSDGSRFAYTYKVTLQNLQDLCRLKAADDHLHWAVKYLVVQKQADNNKMVS